MRRPITEIEPGSVLRVLRCANCGIQFDIEWTDVPLTASAETIDNNTAICAAQLGWSRRRPRYRFWGPERWFCENHR